MDAAEMKYLIAVLFLTGCASFNQNLPNAYGQYVNIIDGPYKGNRGQLIGDCPGFEKYAVDVSGRGRRCVDIWDMEQMR